MSHTTMIVLDPYHRDADLSGDHAAVPGEILEMTANGWLQFVVFFAVLLLLMRPLGLYIARVLEGEKTFLDPVLRPIERLIYRACGNPRGSGDELAAIRGRDADLQLRLAAADLHHRTRPRRAARGIRSIWPA